MLLCGLLQVILAKIGHNLNPVTATQIITLFSNMFMKEQRVAEHVLIAFQGMATSVLGKTIDLKEIGKFIKSALE